MNASFCSYYFHSDGSKEQETSVATYIEPCKENRMSDMTYCQLVSIKRWADLGLYRTLEDNIQRLDEQNVAVICQILDHMHVVDRIFQAHLQGKPHSFQAPRSQTVPDLKSLARQVDEVDGWYESYANDLSPDAWQEPVEFVLTSGKPARMTRSEIILHVCLHGTYHRGNAGAVLQLQGISPSRDAVTDFLLQAA